MKKLLAAGTSGIEKILTGFTLAEVLITLTVIGVIAALTIPALLQNIQDAQLRTSWKEAYSMLDQATKQVLLDHGGTMTGFCGPDSSCFLYPNNYPKYLSISKTCNNASADGCWHKAGQWYALNGGSAAIADNWPSGTSAGAKGVILNNGMLMFGVAVDSMNCAWTSNNLCGHITVDVNGFKGPNTIGKDIFGVYVLATGIKPLGSFGDYDCTSSGYACSRLYLRQ